MNTEKSPDPQNFHEMFGFGIYRFENELISVWLNLHTFRYRSFHFLFGFMFYDASEDKL